MMYPSKVKPLSAAGLRPSAGTTAPGLFERPPKQNDQGQLPSAQPNFWLKPPWSFPVATALVALTTFVIIAVNQAVAAAEPGVYVRPYTGIYLLPLLLMTWAGGRALGFFTLFACCLTAMYFLLPPVGWRVSHPSDWVGLGMFTMTNVLVVFGLDALQHKAALVTAATQARQESAHFSLETQEAQARLQSVTEATQEQRRRELLPLLLLPELPAQIAGLDLRVHYEAMLKDDELGTPFFDSFTCGENCTALVVGAVADSGLAATASVAMTRNMLRSAVYRCPSLTQAITELNEMLAAHQLLSGPARLSVVVYDASVRTAASISCGRASALARRAATGQVTALSESGPLLGLAEGSVYRERRQALSPGDILLLTPGSEADFVGKTGEASDVSCWNRALERPLTTAAVKDAQEKDAQEIIAQLVKWGQEECPPGHEDSVCLMAALVTKEGVTEP